MSKKKGNMRGNHSKLIAALVGAFAFALVTGTQMAGVDTSLLQTSALDDFAYIGTSCTYDAIGTSELAGVTTSATSAGG